MENTSRIRDLVALLSTTKGDLSNTISPPFLLAPKSMTEIPICWIERPCVFAAPALEPDPAKRALLVLKWFIGSLKSQFYTGGDSKLGVKKPLNAFLGELLIGECTDESATARLVVEQVSHHPPITACYMWDEKHGIQCEGFSRVQMTFNGNININQTGQSTVHIDKYEEDYHIPLVNAKVTGFLSGHLHPELFGRHQIVSSSGYIAEMDFCGKGFLTGEKNHFSARVYHKDKRNQAPLYTLCGQWCDKYEIRNGDSGAVIESCDINALAPLPIHLPPITEQDPWETRRAWKKVRTALRKGEMQTTVLEKSKIENAQRTIRKREKAAGKEWTPVFFSKASKTAETPPGYRNDTLGEVWSVDKDLAKHHQKPFHGCLTPCS